MIEVVSVLKGLLGIISKDNDKKTIPLPKDTIQGAFRTDESHPASKYPLRKEECKK